MLILVVDQVSVPPILFMLHHTEPNIYSTCFRLEVSSQYAL